MHLQRLAFHLGISAAALQLMLAAGPAFAASEKTEDRSATGTIEATATPGSPKTLKVSARLRAALDLISAGKVAEAYQAAKSFTDPLERRTVQWAAIYFGDGDVDFLSVQRFTADAPDYTAGTVFKTRLEQAIVKASPPASEIIATLGGHMPNIIEAQIALANAYLADGQKDRAQRIARDIWVNNYLDAGSEGEVLSNLGSLLTAGDHWDRALHLLMHDRAAAADRLQKYLSPAQKSLIVARIAVSRQTSNARSLLAKVDPSLRDHYLYYFSMGQLARENGKLADAVAQLAKAKGDFPDAAEFWYERRTIVRLALAADEYQTAYKAAASYTEGPEGRIVDANFHAGWVALQYLHDPATAKRHFLKMRSLSTLPETVSQANYWLGTALTRLGDKVGAVAAYALAAEYGTLYYGQLARAELGIKGIGLRSLPAWQQAVPQFEKRELVKSVRLLSAAGYAKYAEPLVRSLAQSLRDPGELLLTARLAQSIDAHNIAIHVADIADKRGAALDLFSFPKDGLPQSDKLPDIDKAAIYAIARQESGFNGEAVSRSGALGLMQLMPDTAREVAHKAGLAYSSERLTNDPAYNALLGSTYLAQQLDRFEGSLVLAAVAYNAGGGTANRWIEQFGDPRSKRIDPVSWVERIPFTETRKYVQRVLGNYMVYRARLGDETLTISTALRRIPH